MRGDIYLGACCTSWIFCIFMQKIPIIELLWQFARIKIHESEFLYDFALKRNKLLGKNLPRIHVI
jgi:hypothetical protein